MEAGGESLFYRALVSGRDEDPPFSQPVPRLRTDRLVREGQVWYARVRRRYPGLPPAFKRHAGAWLTDGGPAGATPSPPSARPRLFGLVCAWNEADVIWATVRNLYAQGADRVFLIDDGSTDGTGSEAAAAGAEVIVVQSDGGLLEPERSALLRRHVADTSAAEGGEIWWICVDADEFPRGPGGRTIRAFVEKLPDWVDVAGSRVLEHFPTARDSYTRRQHPAARLPLARWYSYPYCPNGHWKHQLLRVQEPENVFPLVGCHTAGSADGRRLREADQSLLMHHFPLRGRAETTARLLASAERRNANDRYLAERLRNRLAVLDLVYEGRFDEVPNYFFPGERRQGLTLSDWRELVGPSEAELPVLEPKPEPLTEPLP